MAVVNKCDMCEREIQDDTIAGRLHIYPPIPLEILKFKADPEAIFRLPPAELAGIREIMLANERPRRYDLCGGCAMWIESSVASMRSINNEPAEAAKPS